MIITKTIPILCALAVLASCSKKTELNRQLVAAVSRGESARVRELLSRGADPRAREEAASRRTALVIAAEEDFSDIAETLIKAGADVNAKSGDSITPLMNAAMEGNADLAKLLLAGKADPDAADNSGQTALIRAAADGNLEIISILIDRGANINAADRAGLTALMKARINGHTETAELLVGKGARFTESDKAKVEETIRGNAPDEEIIDSENK